MGAKFSFDKCRLVVKPFTTTIRREIEDPQFIKHKNTSSQKTTEFNARKFRGLL